MTPWRFKVVSRNQVVAEAVVILQIILQLHYASSYWTSRNADRSGGTVEYAKKTMSWRKACVTSQSEAAEWIATGLTHY